MRTESTQIKIIKNFLFSLIILSNGICKCCKGSDFVPRQRNFALTELDEKLFLQLCRLTDMDRFKKLLRPLLVARVVDTEQHYNIVKYIEAKLISYGFNVEVDEFQALTPPPYGLKTFRNVIGTFGEGLNRYLVLACHIDSKIMQEGEFIGAIDSAVPCAMLLDLAASFSLNLQNRSNQEIGLKFFFLDGEEAFVQWSDRDSIYGARHLANAMKHRQIINSDGSVESAINMIDVFILLDLLGSASPTLHNIYGLQNDGLYDHLPKIESQLQSLSCVHALPNIFSDGSKVLYTHIEDDHKPFLEHGVPVVHLIPFPFPKHWHKLSDNANALHYETIENILAILRIFTAKYLGITVNTTDREL